MMYSIFDHGVIPKGIDWFWLIGVGIFTQLGQVWITQGLKKIETAQASSINYIQVLFATLWGLIIFRESIEPNTILGAILIFSSTMISVNAKYKPPLLN